MNTPDKKNPVQIVLNASNYIDFQNRPPGGGNHDFFAGQDEEFARHKEKLTVQISSIGESLAKLPVQAAFVKVRLRKQAWAKSHRPTQKFFDYRLFPSAGVDGIGEIYYRVAVSTIPKLLGAIRQAEPETRYKFSETKQKTEPNPSRTRSEVGAVQEVLLPEEADRRDFSVQDAIAWFNDERSGQMYIIDLFAFPRSMGHLLELPREEQKLYEYFAELLNNLPFGLSLFRSSVAPNYAHNFLFARLVREKLPISIQSYFTTSEDLATNLTYDGTENHHKQFVDLLSKHALVRKVTLPPLVQGMPQGSDSAVKTAVFPVKRDGVRYPRVGVVDGGLSPGFSGWIVGSSGVIDLDHRNETHGSFIAGLLVGARAAGNPEAVATELDGCELVDIDIFPNHLIAGAFRSYYPNGFEDFLQELDLAIAVAKQKHNVRVFNISLNLLQQVDETSYGPFAALLDGIAERHDVVLVVSAGNLEPNKFRRAWPTSPSKVPAHLLPYAGTDRLLQPAESVFSLTVGAINPPASIGHLDGAPTPYTRRGPGMKVGVKPDVCHYGGTTKLGAASHENLFSIMGDGRVLTGMGTSYAAPLVAKTIASLESRIEGHIPRESLIALLVHRASVPGVLAHPELRTIARHFVGFGLPAGPEDTLLTDSSAITMVFNSAITAGKELRFDFSWPSALVGEAGRCRGAAHLTLVYKPPIDPNYGAEFVRVNLDAHLRQHEGNGRYKGRAHQIFMQGTEHDAHFEADLIEHGLKWWPIKHYRMTAPRGIGKSSDWRFVVDPLVRDGADFPGAGVPFCAILTIFDAERRKPVFDDMRLWLGAHNVRCEDIRTAARIRARGAF